MKKINFNLIESEAWSSECCAAKPSGKLAKIAEADWDGYGVCSECKNRIVFNKVARLKAKCGCQSSLMVYKLDGVYIILCPSDTCKNREEGEGKTIQETLEDFHKKNEIGKQACYSGSKERNSL